MRKIYSLVVLFIVSTLATTGQVNVTFEVDMNEVAVNGAGVHVAGSFQGWDAGATEMLDASGDSVYSYTVALTATDTIEYKFINGDTWGSEETVPALCATNTNRQLIIPAQDTIVKVCFGECLACGAEVPTSSVTFHVNMGGGAVNDSVFIAGSFQGWSATANQLMHAGDSIYTTTIDLPIGDPIEFKFINGTEWETVPAECASSTNRYFTVPASDTTYKVCYAACDTAACIPVIHPDPDSVHVTFIVNMDGTAVNEGGLYIAGSFQGWVNDSTPMTAAADSLYEATFKLEVGQTIEFKYINGATWNDAETVPEACGQNTNRYLLVPENDTTYKVCYATCDTLCGSNVPEPDSVNVTFVVNMDGTAVNEGGLYIAGAFQGWSNDSTPMTAATDSLYEATFKLQVGETVEFKYINGATWNDAELVPEACAQNTNRSVVVPENDTIYKVCFASCDTLCGSNVPEPDSVNVKFLVNMNGTAVNEGGVYIAGAFQGWVNDSTPMTAIEDSLYEAVFKLQVGETVEFKYINGATWNDVEMVPEACAQNTNRFVTVPEHDTTYTVCFAACDTLCGTDVPAPDSVNVKFKVNMTGVAVNENGVHIAGDFQGWDEDSTMMTAMGDSVYEAVFRLKAGETVEFKYLNGVTWGDAEMVPEACALNQNRFLTVPMHDTSYAVCFALCDMVCDTLGNDTIIDPVCDTESSLPLTLSFSDSTVCEAPIEIILEAFGDFTSFVWSNEEEGPSIDIVGLDTYSVTATDSAGCKTQAHAVVSDEGCAAPVDVTFTVDMNLVDAVSDTGVYLAGNFQGWQPNTTAMDSLGNGIYSITLSVMSGDALEFKFINGNEWTAIESVPEICRGEGNENRSLIVPTEAVEYSVCFGQCGPCVIDSCSSAITLDLGLDIHTCNPDSAITLDAGAAFVSYAWLGVESTDQTVAIDGHPAMYIAQAWDDQGCVARDTVEVHDAGCVPEVNVTFEVDLSNEENVDAAGVYLAGAFQGWNPSATAMTSVGNGIYAVTLALEVGSVHQFKFLNGNDWPGVEAVPEACGVSNDLNREILIPNSDTTYSTCFASCGPCVTDSCFSSLTLNAGADFNTCNLDTAVTLNAGADFVKYAWTGALISDSNAIAITGAEGTYLLAAWDSAGCVARDTVTVTDNGCAAEVQVTFEVDLSQTTVSAAGVHVAGNFQGWDPAATELDSVGEGRYAVTLTLEEGETVEFKYLNGDAWDGSEETVPEACAVNTNRTFVVPDSDTTYSVCFEACGPCVVDLCTSTLTLNAGADFSTCATDTAVTLTATGEFLVFDWSTGSDSAQTVIDGTPTSYYVAAWDSAGCVARDTVTVSNTGCIPSVNVTFEVDMSNETVSNDGIHVAGSFQGWDPAATTLADQGNGTYLVTLSIEVGSALEFKFVNGAAWGSEEAVPTGCAQNTNRFFTVPAADTTYSVCYQECVDCSDIVKVAVTLTVDLGGLDSISSDGVHVAGSFQGWNPSTTELTLVSGTTYSVTLEMEPGADHEYKFLNGNAWPTAGTPGAPEIVPSQCGTVNADSAAVNRMLTVPGQDTAIAVCFAQCSESCAVSVAELKAVIGLNVYPNPSLGLVTVTTAQSTATVTVTDMLGHVVSVQQIQNGSGQIDLVQVPEGMYLLNVATPAGSSFAKLQIQH